MYKVVTRQKEYVKYRWDTDNNNTNNTHLPSLQKGILLLSVKPLNPMPLPSGSEVTIKGLSPG